MNIYYLRQLQLLAEGKLCILYIPSQVYFWGRKPSWFKNQTTDGDGQTCIRRSKVSKLRDCLFFSQMKHHSVVFGI